MTLKATMLTIGLVLAAQGALALTATEVASDLQGQGYTRVEIRVGPTQIKAEAVRGTEKVEIIYDAATGAVLKSESEPASSRDMRSSGVSVGASSSDFVAATPGTDDHSATAGDNGSDDNGGTGSDNEAGDDHGGTGNDDSAGDDQGGSDGDDDGHGNGDDHGGSGSDDDGSDGSGDDSSDDHAGGNDGSGDDGSDDGHDGDDD